MVGIIKNIVDVARALFGFKDILTKANQQRRNEMADYFHAISSGLAGTYEKLAENLAPHGCCGELRQYAD